MARPPHPPVSVPEVMVISDPAPDPPIKGIVEMPDLTTIRFDKAAYQREYMRAYRARKRKVREMVAADLGFAEWPV